MRAVQFDAHGGPEVLRWAAAPEPHVADAGVPAAAVRVSVAAASVNAVDWKIRSGLLGADVPRAYPGFLGFDAAGVVDEVGADVTGVQPGDEVFGLGTNTHAEYAVLRHYAAKPAAVGWVEAAAAGNAGETAVRVLDLLGVGHGTTLVIDGAAGGVGAVAVQVAVARGAAVLGTASERNHRYLGQLGATPVTYGLGMADRVRAAVGGHVDAVFDVVGKTQMADLVSLVGDPAQVVSIANFAAPEHGARATGGGGDPSAALRQVADLLAARRLRIEVQTFLMSAAGEAHRLLEQGHVRGKLVLVPG
jgi:NADPH:quinone reductase-like Zn-dependent oxidoreductase